MSRKKGKTIIKTLTLFETRDQKSFRLSRSQGWIDLGGMGVHSLLILQDNSPDSDPSKVYLQVRSHSGRPPIVNACITRIRAIRHEKKRNEIHWTVHNVASYDHTRTFATRFKHERDASSFLTLFNAFTTTVEVNEWLVNEEERLEKVSTNSVTDDEEQGEVNECQNVLDEADDSLNDDDFNACTQNWPDWHDISIPLS